ncbi:PSME3-interacting protein-like [Glandiceps talaboti]
MAEGISFRSFVSETELDEKRQKRQEEWEKVRNEDQPEECPDEEYDPRSLFERLQEQKDKKQEEFEEKFKFKNMIYKGLDDGEAEFLDHVSDRQIQIQKERMTEEKEILKEYKESVSALTQDKVNTTPKPADKKPIIGGKKSQMALLAGAVKRKRSSSDDIPDKKTKSSEKPTDGKQQETSDIQKPENTAKEGSTASATTQSTSTQKSPTATYIGVLPGLGVYSESSDSDSSSSDSEIVVVSNLVSGLRK